MTDHAAIFSRLYTASSGAGSSKEFTAPYREYLVGFMNSFRIRSVVDLGCGDMTVMSAVMGDLEHWARYFGVDIIDYRIQENRRLYPWGKFEQGDARTYEVPECDLLICKDVLQHWTNVEVNRFLARLPAMPFKYALLTNCNYGPLADRNVDIEAGGWRPLDLRAAPFFINDHRAHMLVLTWGDQHAGYKDTILVKGGRR